MRKYITLIILTILVCNSYILATNGPTLRIFIAEPGLGSAAKYKMVVVWECNGSMFGPAWDYWSPLPYFGEYQGFCKYYDYGGWMELIEWDGGLPYTCCDEPCEKKKVILSKLIENASDLYGDLPAGVNFDDWVYGEISRKLEEASKRDNEAPLEKIRSEEADPVYSGNGEYGHSETDLVVGSDRGLPIVFTRTYGSRREYNGRFGYGWDLNYNLKVRRLTGTTLDVVVFLNGKGYRREYLRVSGTDNFTNDSDPGNYLHYDDIADTFQYIKKNQTVYQFDDNDKLSSITDRVGNKILFDYEDDGLGTDLLLPVKSHSKYFLSEEFGGPVDARGTVMMEYKLRTITQVVRDGAADELSHTLTLEYDDDDPGSPTDYGVLVKITEDSTGREWEYEYDDATNDLRYVKQPETSEYNEAGENRLTTEYIYDWDHHLQKVIAPREFAEGLDEYYINNTYEDDQVTEQVYGASELSPPGDSTWEFAYDEETNQTTITNRKDFTKIIDYNEAGQAIRETINTDELRDNPADPASYITEYEYNNNYDIVKTKLPKGNCVYYTYDSNGNVLSISKTPQTCDALNFNGSDEYVEVSDSGAYSFNADTADFSVAVWVKRSSTGVVEFLLDKRDAADDGWSLSLDSNNKVVFSLDNVDVTSTTDIADNDWHLIVVVVDRDTNIKIYIDDDEADVTTAISSDAMDISANLFVGKSSYESSGHFEGIIDNVMVFNQTLLSEEVLELTKDTSGLIGFWEMDDNTDDTTVTDSSTSQIDGDLPTGHTTEEAHTRGKLLKDITTTYTYESTYNFVKTILDPKGKQTTFTYDYEGSYPTSVGNLVKITYPSVDVYVDDTLKTVHPVVEFTYNNYGQVLTKTVTSSPDEGYERITKYEYYDDRTVAGDPNYGRLAKVTQDYGTGCLNIETVYQYDEYGHIKTLIDDELNETYFQYNELEQLKQTTTPVPFEYEAKLHYDENGNLDKSQAQYGSVFNEATCQETLYSFNLLDKLDEITDTLGYLTENHYDDNDNLASVLDPEGRDADPQYQTDYIYDERDLLWEVTDAEGNTTEYWYDENGNLKKIKDAKDQETTYTYDDYDRLTIITYPDDTTEEFDYDDNGNMISKTNRKSESITYLYDDLNRLKVKSGPDFSDINYFYNISGNVDRVTVGSDTTTYDYDRLGRLEQVNDPESRDIGYEYDNLSRRTKLTYPDSSFITYHYDNMSRLTDIKDSSGNVIVHYEYDELSRRTDLYINYDRDGDYQETGDGLVTYDYEDKIPANNDNLGNRVETLTNVVNASDTLTFGYNYDKVGNVSDMDINSDPYSFDYDNIYQLLFADFPTGSFSDISYEYDSLGSRTRTYDGTEILYDTSSNYLNQYDTVGPLGSEVPYSYDNNGNLTNDGSYTFHYDSENRLILVRDNSDTTDIAAYTYDYLGRRAEKTVYGSPDVTTKYCYDGGQVIAEYDGTTLLRKFIYGPGIDEPIAMVVPNSPDIWYFYIFDALGNVVALVNESGNIVEGYSYDYFGYCRVHTGPGTDTFWFTSDDVYPSPDQSVSAIGNPYRFTGRRYDEETGLYYYRARYYDYAIGRFLQTDPVGYADSMNLYTYVGNNPINFIDPFGLSKGSRGFWEKLWDGDYVGTQYGQGSMEWYAQRYVNADNAWDKFKYGLGGLLSAAWTPDTWKDTAMTLAGGWAAGRAAAKQAVKTTLRNCTDDIVIEGFHGSLGPNPYHALDQAITRGVSPTSIINTLKNPAVKISQGVGRTAYISRDAIVVLDKTGQAVTVIGQAQFDLRTLQILTQAGVIP